MGFFSFLFFFRWQGNAALEARAAFSSCRPRIRDGQCRGAVIPFMWFLDQPHQITWELITNADSQAPLQTYRYQKL